VSDLVGNGGSMRVQYDFSKGVRGKYHSCHRLLNYNYPAHAQAQEGDRWTCTCGKVYEHICDEAEGCSWVLASRSKEPKGATE
jgi:hypothetical protein